MSGLMTLRDLSFGYPGAPKLFSSLSLDLHPGEVLGIVGRNGAGKSTLLRVLNGLLRPDAGDIRINGQSTLTMPVHLIARHAGTLYQSPEQQLFASTVREEVAFGPREIGKNALETTARVDAALERTELTAMADRHPLDLDYATRRFVALASILAMGPSVLLLDEPQRGLDRRHSLRLERIIAEEQAAGHGIVLICHDMDLVERIADSVLALGVPEPKPQSARALFENGEALTSLGLERPIRHRVAELLAPKG